MSEPEEEPKTESMSKSAKRETMLAERRLKKKKEDKRAKRYESRLRSGTSYKEDS